MNVSWNGKPFPRLSLGCAQLGMPYGIANRAGRPDAKTAEEIVRTALDSGITAFDTAQAYGCAEAVLGKALQTCNAANHAKVISKISPELEDASPEELVESVQESIRRIGVPRLFSLMLHRGSWLANWEGKYAAASREMLKKGISQTIGVSIYEMDEFELAMQIPEIQTIQLPFNLLDQRARQNDCFHRAQKAGKLLFVRSIYLQGLLLLSRPEMEAKLPMAEPYLRDIRKAAAKRSLPVKELALGFVLRSTDSASLVMGAETAEQILENLQLARQVLADTSNDTQYDYPNPNPPLDIINPTRWNRTTAT